MTRLLKTIVLITIGSSCFCELQTRSGQTHTAASPSLADVRAAISSARSGDTIIVPPGAAT